MGLLTILVGIITKPRSILLSVAIFTTVSAAVIANIQDGYAFVGYPSSSDPQQEQNINQIEQLPFCGDESERTISRRLLYVTTLDGKLTALDISNNGREYWSLSTAPGPLISSSIHRLELTNNGQLVRMIPSLSGGIYKFDGHTIDPVPVTAEHLLSSSFKFSDDLIISGGKETRSYGISARTGQLIYECNIQGCHNFTDSFSVDNNRELSGHDPLLDDVIVVRRQTQTVRAVEPRTGSERWNFSVGHHELELLASPECHDRPKSNLDLAMLDLEVKVIVPDGIICAFSKSNPGVLLWKYQFNSPIVSVWQIDGNDALKSIDIFNQAQWMFTPTTESFGKEKSITPSIYLGMFQKQLYIQESTKMQKLVIDQTRQFTYHLVSSNSNFLSIPWKPIPATSSGLALVTDDSINADSSNALIQHEDEKSKSQEDDENTSVTALSVLYASEYVNGNGFFLFTSSDVNKTEIALCNSNSSLSNVSIIEEEEFIGFDFSGPEPPVQVIILSLWYWWKEIVVISLTTALIINLILSPKIHREREVVVIERHIPVPTAIEATEENITRSNNNSSGRSLSESGSNNSENFVSRFQADFDLIQCLGKGGFGVVFEAKNKLDERNYAVKRIQLPNRKESRDRVMREVKTLANCEHQNIVRYFQAWVETPPPGWQEIEDEKWMQRDILSTSIDIETPDGTTLPRLPIGYSSSINSILSDQKKIQGAQWSSKFGDQSKELDSWFSKANNNNNDIDSDDDDDSLIQFKEDSKSSKENSVTIDILSKKTTKSCNFNDEDISSSLEIEFKNSTNGYGGKDNNTNDDVEDKSEISVFERNKSVTTSTSAAAGTTSVSRYNYHRSRKRPMSLDISSKGNVIVPLPSPNNQQSLIPQKPQQNKVFLYIQMQLCRKQSLRDWLRENRTREQHVKNIFKQIVDAVDYVHLKGLIHRDLKPSNIFFSLDGQIKIGDFGLVTDISVSPDNNRSIINGEAANDSQIDRFYVADVKHTHTHIHTKQVGTHLYMSPEQLEGKPYDFKVDIYSLGLIFFELLKYFETEMERILTLKGLRDGKFPSDFQEFYPDEFDLLRLMVSSAPHERPSTFQIKEKLQFITLSAKSKIFA